MTPQERKRIAYDASFIIPDSKRKEYIKHHTLDPKEIESIMWLANRYEKEEWQ